MTARATRLVVPGVVGVGGDTCAEDTNTWRFGDDRECALIDPAGDLLAITDLVGSATVKAVLCTHAHDAHIDAAVAVSEATGAMVFLHQDDFALWMQHYPSHRPDVHVVEGMSLVLGGARLQALHTPGHTPGGVCWYSPDLGAVFTGDTLGAGGAGHVSHLYSNYDALTSAIRRKLFMLPTDTVVLPGHGESTRIGSMRWDIGFWGTTTQRRPDSRR